MKKIQAISVVLLFMLSFSVNPEAQYWNQRGLEFYKEGRYEEATKAFQRAIEIDPEYAEAHSNLGIVYYHLEKYEESLKEFTQVVSLDPDTAQYRINLAAAYERCGNRAEAIRELQLYLQMRSWRADDDEVRAVHEVINKLSGKDTSSSYSGGLERIDLNPADELFRFIHIADIHMGEDFDGGTQDSDYLTWLCQVAFPQTAPEFIVATGDLTDSTNGGLIPLGGPYQAEWDQYKNILRSSWMSRYKFYDCPGNHDHYSDKDFSYYLSNSIQGIATGSTQFSWTIFDNGDLYQFIGINTAGNDGKPWPIDNAGLDQAELGWMRVTVNPNAKFVFFFGHHPIGDLEYGGEEFETILERQPSAYLYGHTHSYGVTTKNGVQHVNVASIGKSGSNHYLLVRVLNNGDVVISPHNVYELPSEAQVSGVRVHPYASLQAF